MALLRRSVEEKKSAPTKTARSARNRAAGGASGPAGARTDGPTSGSGRGSIGDRAWRWRSIGGSGTSTRLRSRRVATRRPRRRDGADKTRAGAAAGAGARGAGGRARAKSGLLYVIQKHDASRLHYDFRLELDGVLLSWAIPKGPSLDPRDRHLAARTEDHPLEYGTFEGTIPEGEYGGGTVLLWDRGTWEPEGDPHEMLRKGDLKFTLHGEKLNGSWVLVRMKPRPERGDKEEWLLIKHRDDESVDGDGQRILEDRPESVASGRSLRRSPPPARRACGTATCPPTSRPRPAPARTSSSTRPRCRERTGAETAAASSSRNWRRSSRRRPQGDDWLHEIKFDGYRAISRIEKGSVRMYSRNGKDWTDRYRGHRRRAGQAAGGERGARRRSGRAPAGRADELPGAAERSRGGEGPTAGAGEDSRLLYYVFDLLYLDGQDLTKAAIEDRKELLRRLLARVGQGGRILYSEHIAGSGAKMFERGLQDRARGHREQAVVEPLSSRA